MKRILILSFIILFLWSCSKDEVPLDDADYKIKLSGQISLVANSMIQDAVNKDGMLDPDAIADEIEKIDGVKTATVTPSRTTIHIKQENGGEMCLFLVTMDDDRMFIESTKKSPSKSFLDEIEFSSDFIIPNGEGKALILAPFQSVFQETLNYYKVWLEQAGYSVDIYMNESASLDKFRGSFLDDYDIVYISTHGSTTYLDSRYINFIMTGEIVSDQRDRSLDKEDLKDYIVYGWHVSQRSLERYSISPQWLRETSDNAFPNTWIFINACYSAYDNVEYSLANTCFKLGAVGFNGWMYSPNIWWASVVGATMLHYFTHGYSFEDASDIVRDNSLAGILNIRIPLPAIDINTFIDKQNSDLTDPFYLIPPCIDYEGNVYRTVKIGNQWWMAENLACLPSVGPYNIQSAIAPMYYVYDYYGTDISEAKSTFNYMNYGVLYNWVAAKNSCPTGWHLPSDDEWKELETFLGMPLSDLDIDSRSRGTMEGGKLKEEGNIHWVGPNVGATNEYGFTARGGGARYVSYPVVPYFDDLCDIGYWWTSTERIDIQPIWVRSLINMNAELSRFGEFKENGFSVRCIKD